MRGRNADSRAFDLPGMLLHQSICKHISLSRNPNTKSNLRSNSVNIECHHGTCFGHENVQLTTVTYLEVNDGGLTLLQIEVQ